MRARAVVTGAFSYIGAAVARELISRGWQVHTLTHRRRPKGAPEGLTSAALRFDREHLARELDGADLLVNTYWVRLPHAEMTFDAAVAHSHVLLEAARTAGVRRLAHVSVSNAALDSGLAYYAGKARVEGLVRQAGLPYAIVRPTLVVGPRDVLTNNIAWFLRRFPFFLVPGGGGYRVQPITLDDAGRVIADAAETDRTLEIDAAGPAVMAFRQYVALVGRAVGRRRPLVAAPPWLTLLALRVAGMALGDVVLTVEELLGLKQERLVSHAPPLGRESVEEWLLANGATLGRTYANDLVRHFGTGASAPIAW